ncbi:unnamed protein product, partial [Protopolystoma xenopodis]
AYRYALSQPHASGACTTSNATPAPSPPHHSPLCLDRLTAGLATATGYGSSYIAAEQAAIEVAQRELDEEAGELEARIRAQQPGSPQEEELLRRWLPTVNRKNALIHRERQLFIM